MLLHPFLTFVNSCAHVSCVLALNFHVMKNLATLNPEKLQGFKIHGTPLYHCYNLTCSNISGPGLTKLHSEFFTLAFPSTTHSTFTEDYLKGAVLVRPRVRLFAALT